MHKQKLISLKFEVAIPATIFILTHSIYAGDIEQILPASSNFTIDGDGAAEVMRVQSDGKVGIGTTTPNERLEVNGHIRMTDGNQAANTVMIGDADGTASWADITTLQNSINTDDQALQDFNITNNLLSITLENGGTLTVDLSALDNNGTDDQAIQDLALDANNILTVGIEDGASSTVDLSALNNAAAVTAVQDNLDTHIADDNDTSATNELITNVSFTGDTLTITENGVTHDINLSNLNDTGTDDQTITDLSLTGDTLSLAIEDGNTITVDLAALNDTTAIAAVNTALTAHVADDNDTSSSNEIQTLTSTDGSVILTNTGNDYDLSVNFPAQTVTSLTQQASPNQLDYTYTSEDATQTTLRSSPIVAFGKVDGTGTLQRGYGATVTRNSTGNYTITLGTARPSADYTIQLTILDSNGLGNDDYDISYSNQAAGSFVVQTGDNDNGAGDRAQRDSEFMFTVIDY